MPEFGQIYRETLEDVVFLGLDAMGIDTQLGRAWLSERTRT